MPATAPDARGSRRFASLLDRTIFFLSRYWFAWFMAFFGALVVLPWLAPVFMHWGWEAPARAIYGLYSLLCHQLPQRSFFLFGQEPSYSLAQIQSAWRSTFDPMFLRTFIGNPVMGFKVAWSDRMVSLYSSIPLAGLLWWPLRKRLRPLPIWGLALIALPILIDGASHFISDLSGIDQGFRIANQWLVTITGGRFPSSFYHGNALGSFNSWMRLITGALFGVGVVWATFPYMDMAFSETARTIDEKVKRRVRVS